MGFLFVYTFFTCFLVFVGFMFNYNWEQEVVPQWYLIAHIPEVLLYCVYLGVRNLFDIERAHAMYLFFFLHDLVLVGVVLLMVSKFMYVGFLLFYYSVFFGVVVVQRMRPEVVRSSLPRKTFIEMTELN